MFWLFDVSPPSSSRLGEQEADPDPIAETPGTHSALLVSNQGGSQVAKTHEPVLNKTSDTLTDGGKESASQGQGGRRLYLDKLTRRSPSIRLLGVRPHHLGRPLLVGWPHPLFAFKAFHHHSSEEKAEWYENTSPSLTVRHRRLWLEPL